MKAKIEIPKYLIGVEIETSLKELDCSDCDQCLVCNSCPTCEECDLCSVCNERLAERYDMTCEEVSERGWCVDICEYCNPCNGCEYYRNSEYCPESRDHYYLPNDFLKKYFMSPYEDGSCGMEYPTRPFDNLSDYYYVLQKFLLEIDRDYLDPYHRCGGHTNISFEGWKHYKSIIYNNAIYFMDLLAYMFLSSYSYRRSGYQFFPNTIGDCDDKYSVIHFKTYCIEYRLPDSPYDANNHLLLSTILLSLSMLKTKIEYPKKEFIKTKELYTQFKDGDFSLSGKDKKYLRRKFRKMYRYVKPYLKIFGKEVGLDLNKMLRFRFRNPTHSSNFLLDNIIDKFKL